MGKRWLLVLVVACSSSKHEPREPARGFDPTSVPVAPKPDPTSVPVAPAPRSTGPACAPRAQPKACPATEPNINHPCSPKGLQCTYGTSCCPPIYVCNGAGVFEAQFVHCT